MCKVLIECTAMVPRYISFDTFETLHFPFRLVQSRRKNAQCVCHTVENLLDYSQRCDLSVVKIYIFFQIIELPLYQNSIVDAMRMYLGHICTVVLLPSCHPHCLSYLAFTYYRTKSLFFSLQRRCGVLFYVLYMTSLTCFLDTTVTLNINFLIMLVLSLLICSMSVWGSAFIWLHGL